MEEKLWVEKYRPKTIMDCILPDRIKNTFQSYVDKKEIPNLLLNGPAGCGKTTVAKAMCNQIGCNYLFVNASNERGIDTLRTKIIGYASTVSLTGGKKVIILDEADKLTPDAQDALKGVIEEFSSNCSFIFTSNFKAKLIDAIHSRTAVIEFGLKVKERMVVASQILKRLQFILTTEGVEYDKEVLVKLMERFFPDHRRLIGEAQRFSSSGQLGVNALTDIEDLRNFKDLLKSLKEKNFTNMRKWVASNADADLTTLNRMLFDRLSAVLKPETIPPVIIVLAKYAYQAAFVADQELNTTAMLTEVMVEGEFK